MEKEEDEIIRGAYILNREEDIIGNYKKEEK